MTEPAAEPKAEVVPTGYWREDGTFQEPEGWPEGAGWVVKDADGTIVNSGPASDFVLVATTDLGDEGPLPPAEHLGIALKGLPTPEQE
jgi:hypothetical protein